MNILFLTQTYPRFADDTAGPFIRDLARGLVRLGSSVTVLVPHAVDVASRWREEGVEAVSFRYAPARWEVLGYGRSLQADETVKAAAAGVTPLYALGALAALRRELRRRSYHLVHAHWVVPNGVIAAHAVKPAVPLAIGLHGSGVFLAEKPGVRSIVRGALRRARLLTGCSPELVERVRALGFQGDAWRVIPYGVDTEAFSPDPGRRGLWRRRLGIEDSSPLALSVGRMATKKGFHVLIEALPEIFRAHPEAHFVLAGGGDRLQEFRRATARWSSQVHFPGSVDRDTLPDLFRAADLFVLPAVHDLRGNVDGLPNVVLEAMATGLPVVATRISGIPLAVSSGVEGLLVPEKAPVALGEAITALLSDPSRRRALGEAGRARALRELTWDAIARRYLEAYRAVAGC